jgi:GH24 family phage-related lysozyme (muramidase)
MNEHLSVGKVFFRLVDEFENAPPGCPQTPDGCALEAYLCPSDQWTIGDGCCFWEDGTPVKEGDTLPNGPGLAERRRSLLAFNAQYCEEYVRKYVTVPLTQNQFDVLCDFRFNTRETTLRNSSRLLPAVNAQEWQKAAIALTEFVYGTTSHEGKAYQKAMRGLLRRRLWQGLLFLDYEPSEAVKDGDVALPCDRVLLKSGIYRDNIRSDGLTTLNIVKMRATKLAEPDSANTINKPAPPPVPGGQAAEKLGAPVAPKPELSASPAAQKSPASVSAIPTAGVGQAAAPGSPAQPSPVSKPAPVVLPSQVQKPPPEPVIIAPKQIDMRGVPYGEIPPDAKPKNMTEAARVIGLVIVGIGSIVQVLSAREIISTTIGAIFYDLSRDAAFVAMAAGGLAMVVGWTTRKRGTAVVVKGMVNARALLK